MLVYHVTIKYDLIYKIKNNIYLNENINIVMFILNILSQSNFIDQFMQI